MTEQHDSIILNFVVRVLLVPFIFVFGVYVLVHGEASPGGGFQAGAIVAAGLVLARLTTGSEHGERRISTRVLLWLASAGIGIYVLAGIVPLLAGVNFLDYAALPVEWFNAVAGHERTNRAMGIFIVEVGIFIGVFSVLVILYDHLTERFTDD
ncbi:MAG: sodium:proton antiporter [Chloroflexi bacterium]|nr:sodium:proton antiporter [Chloroflexota bacterium]MCI0778719.1 sodium:proton antiporter [Chloroflexota bacterium]MCI0816059.1 sodium:proton antiporter [Chloroflexota bacterium]MCI0888233.1 sodium:proton antiporter [Chloroflexota bacterium]